jgi:NADH ubiquinone oxidoreductase subunit NDUFA12
VSLLSSSGDTKAGTLIATDRYGNKYFENLADELPRESGLQARDGEADANKAPVRTRWVDYKDKDFDAYGIHCDSLCPREPTILTPPDVTGHKLNQDGTRGYHTWSTSHRRRIRFFGQRCGLGSYGSIGLTRLRPEPLSKHILRKYYEIIREV